MKQWDSIRNSLSATQFIIWGWDGQEVWTTTEQILWTYLHPPLIHKHQTYLLLAGGQTWEPSRQGSVAGETDVQATEASGSGRWITPIQLFLFASMQWMIRSRIHSLRPVSAWWWRTAVKTRFGLLRRRNFETYFQHNDFNSEGKRGWASCGRP